MIIEPITLARVLSDDNVLVFWEPGVVKWKQKVSTNSSTLDDLAWEFVLGEHVHGASTEDLPGIYQRWWGQQGKATMFSHANFSLDDEGRWCLRERGTIRFFWLRAIGP